jgi:hypothetical protein
MLSEPSEAALEPILEGQAWDRFDPLGRPWPNDRNLRIPAGWSPRKAAIAGRENGRLDYWIRAHDVRDDTSRNVLRAARVSPAGAVRFSATQSKIRAVRAVSVLTVRYRTNAHHACQDVGSNTHCPTRLAGYAMPPASNPPAAGEAGGALEWPFAKTIRRLEHQRAGQCALFQHVQRQSPP